MVPSVGMTVEVVGAVVRRIQSVDWYTPPAGAGSPFGTVTTLVVVMVTVPTTPVGFRLPEDVVPAVSQLTDTVEVPNQTLSWQPPPITSLLAISGGITLPTMACGMRLAGK